MKVSVPYYLLALSCLLLSLLLPQYNWDAIGYIGSAHSIQEKETKKLHHYAYQQFKQLTSAYHYNRMTTPKRNQPYAAYRSSIYNNPKAFKEQLPFYQIRPIYVWLIYLLSHLGFHILTAIQLISGVSVATGVFFFYSIIKHEKKDFILIFPAFAVMFGILELSRFSTPDGLAFCALAGISLLFLNQEKEKVLFISPILIGIRTDLLLFTIPLYLYFFIQYKEYRRVTLLSFFATLFVYIWIIVNYAHPGWATTFYATMVSKQLYPLSQPPIFTFKHYAHSLKRGILITFRNKAFLLYLIITGTSCVLAWRQIQKKNPLKLLQSEPFVLAMISFFFVCSHFLLFPVSWDRFFTAPYLLGLSAYFKLASNSPQNNDNT